MTGLDKVGEEVSLYTVGSEVGSGTGFDEGLCDGLWEGSLEGIFVGCFDFVGFADGRREGLCVVGTCVGLLVSLSTVGEEVGALINTQLIS